MSDQVQAPDSAANPSQETPVAKEVSTLRLMATLTVAAYEGALLEARAAHDTRPVIEVCDHLAELYERR